MEKSSPPPQTPCREPDGAVLRSVIALVGGFAIMTFTLLVATVVAAAVMRTSPGVETTPFFETILASAVLAAAFGGYSTASLAAQHHAAHTVILATMVLIMGASTALNPPAGQPQWLVLGELVLTPLAVLGGGQLRALQRRRHAAGPGNA